MRITAALLSLVLVPASVLVSSGTIDAQRSRRGRRTGTTQSAQAAPAASDAPENPFEEPAPAADAAASPATNPAAGPATNPAASPAASPASPAPAASSAPASPAASGAAPAASSAPASTATDPGVTPPDVAPVRAELGRVMDDMVQTRQRMAVLGQELFRTRIRIAVQDRAGDDQSLARFVVELDGAPVFRTDGEIEGGDRGRTVHEGALAPGPHVLTIETEQRARQDAEVRYAQRETFRVQVHRDRLTDIEIVLDDDSAMVDAFQRGGEGRYEIRTRVRVATRELPAGTHAAPAAASAPAASTASTAARATSTHAPATHAPAAHASARAPSEG